MRANHEETVVAAAQATGPAAAGRAAQESTTTAPRPEHAVHGARVFASADRLLGLVDTFLARYLPNEFNPLAQAGRACNCAILVAVVSGVLLLCWYSPSLELAYRSVAGTVGNTLGGFVRTLHRYSSDLVMFFALLHALRMMAARKFSGAKWLPWVSGIGLLSTMWFIGWTGYWLVWDQPAQQIAVTSMRLLDALPIFGEPMGRLYVADRMVPSLLFFVVFFLHMLLPLGIAVGLAVHLLRVNRIRLLPDWRLGAGLLAGLVLASLLAPAPLDAAAQMTRKAETFTLDAWYLSPLAITLRFQGAGPWLAVGGAVLATAALPWLLGRRRRPESFQTRVDPSRCHACTQCVQDCPFDAVHMVGRTDGKRFASQAFVDPARCVGCGVCVGSCDSEAMSLGWFDTRREEARIQAEITRQLREKPFVALVAEDIDSGFALYRASLWRERLSDYHVQFVPTASWVRPKLLERLFSADVKGVLIVRDARAESAARDGNAWVEARLSGERHPVYRPERAGGGQNWCVLDYDASRPRVFSEKARAFASGRTSVAGGKGGSKGQRMLVIAGVAAAIALMIVPLSRLTVKNPAPAGPEFVFSFRALGDRAEAAMVDAAAEAAKPVHMRGQPTQKPQRLPVTVRISIDGSVFEQRYEAKGISRDGPALDQVRRPLSPGNHDVVVEVISGPNMPAQRWAGSIQTQTRRISVLTFEPQSGFRLEE